MANLVVMNQLKEIFPDLARGASSVRYSGATYSLPNLP